MPDREKLIELVHDARMNALWHNAQKPSEYIADMLIANGVVVREKGEWEKEGPYTSVGGEYKKALICPKCFSYFVSDGNTPWQLHNFCPNCGADMRKGENG